MIDLHCHFLPGVDDGPDTIEQSVELVAMAHADGIRHSVVTPHILLDRWPNRRANLEPLLVNLRNAVAARGIDIALSLGAEVRMDAAILPEIDDDNVPTIGHWRGKRVLLLELPDGDVPSGTEQFIEHLERRGIVGLIAHPERNRRLMQEPSRVQPIVSAGALLQITAGSILGKFGARAQRTAAWLMDRTLVTVVATDAHNVTHRPPSLRAARDAVRSVWGEDEAHRLFEINAREILGVNDSR
jgi:protein-tyrosine phosphatase